MNHLKSITESIRESSSQPSNGMASHPRVTGQTLPCYKSQCLWPSHRWWLGVFCHLPGDSEISLSWWYIKLPRNPPYISSLLLDIWWKNKPTKSPIVILQTANEVEWLKGTWKSVTPQINKITVDFESGAWAGSRTPGDGLRTSSQYTRRDSAFLPCGASHSHCVLQTD